MIPAYPSFYVVGDCENGHGASRTDRMNARLAWLAKHGARFTF